MPQAKSWMTSDDIIASVKRRISFPVSQNTFTNDDILAFANEELLTSQVPSILQYHEEYYVYRVDVPLTSNQSRYSIPDRAIGMKLRDIKWSDQEGNFFDMTRIADSDKGFFQRSTGANQDINKFYMEGNDVVLTPQVVSGPTGTLNFFIFIRPNQLVNTARAAYINNFNQTISLSSVVNGNTLYINGISYIAGTNFTVGVSDSATATNLAVYLNTQARSVLTDLISATAVSTNVTLRFSDQLYIIDPTQSSSTFGIPLTTMGVEFVNLPSTYTDPVTNITENLFVDGVLVDFLQTKPGHKIETYDVMIPNTGIAGNIITFTASDIPESAIIGDYICLANECVIPYLPPDLHNILAERTANRILMAIGDQAGLQISNTKLQEMEKSSGELVDNRVEDAPKKILARHTVLRYNKNGNGRRY